MLKLLAALLMLSIPCDSQIKPAAIEGYEYDDLYWPSMGAKTALDLPLFGPGPGAETKGYSGSGNNGTLTGGASFAPSLLGQSLLLDGSTGYLQCASSALIAGVDWTIGAQILIPSGTAGSPNGRAIYAERYIGNSIVKLDCLATSDTYVHSAAVVLRNDAGVLLFTKGTKVIDDGKPHLILAIKSGTSVQLYVDGQLDAVGNWTGSDTYTDTMQTRVGSDAVDSGAFFAGYIGQVFAIKGVAVNAAQEGKISDQPWSRFSRRQAVVGGSAAPAGGQLLLLRRRAAA